MHNRRPLAALLLLSLAASGCTKKETDEDRLRKKLDVLPVHLYAGAKATLAEEMDEAKREAATKALRDLVLAGVAKVARPSESASVNLSLSDVTKLGGAVAPLRKRGVEIVREGKDHRPMLPALLGPQRVFANLSSNSEHALILAVLLLARFHPSVPIPIPEELILFEASRTDAAALDPKSLALPVRVFKAYVFARSELCDLALREAEAVQSTTSGKEDVLAVLRLAGASIQPKTAEQSAAALEALTHGAVSLCYFQRDEEKKGRTSLRSMIEGARRAGLEGRAELELLQAYLDCADGKETVAAGQARLVALSKRKDLERSITESVPVMQRCCESTAGARFDLSKKVSFSRMLVGLALVQAERAGVTGELEKTEVYQAVRRFGLLTGKLSELAPGSGGGWKEVGKGAAGGIWNRLRGGGERKTEKQGTKDDKKTDAGAATRR